MTTIKNTQRLQPPAGSYDQKLDQRVVKHECLRDRNNATTCRSPTRLRDVEWKRNELQQKRQQEFLKRRQIDQPGAPLVTERKVSKEPKAVLRVKGRKANPLDRRSLVMAEDLGITWPDTASIKQAPWVHPTGCPNWEAEAAGHPLLSRSPRVFPPLREQPQLERTCTRREKGTQTQDGLHRSQSSTRDISTQTHVEMVGYNDYVFVLFFSSHLKEAIWREENLKRKLAVFQQSTSALLLSSDALWRAHCSEDLTRIRTEALEAQLQVCAQKFKRDGVKKLVLQMEEQKRDYEEKATAALHKALTEKMDTEKKAADLEWALQAARAESARWQGLCLELKDNCEQLQRNQEQTSDKLHLLQSQLEREEGQEADLRHQVQVLQQEGADLRSQVAQLEEDNQAKQEQLQEMSEKLWNFEDPSLNGSFFQSPSRDMWNSIGGLCVSDSRPSAEQPPGSESEVQAQAQDQMWAELRETQQRLTMKEKECMELRAELEALEHECHSCLSRLTQCREELRQLNARRSQSSCCSWWCLGLLMTVVMVVLLLLLMYNPIYADQFHGVCRGLRQSVERYLQERTSPKHSGCYRPV
ncbi:TRAF3-interacting JNK-activating modulator isoform X1 [Arapaima gigas]